MRKTFLFTMAALLVMALVISACAAPAAPADDSQGPAKVTLKVLIHQNPPMVDFMTKFNDEFTARHPNITVDMSVVNANDLSTVTQTRLTANDVDVVDIFGFANAAQPYMKNVDPPNWQTLIEAGYLMTKQRSLMPAVTMARFMQSTLGAFPIAASMSTRTFLLPITLQFPPPGANWSLPAKRSRLPISHA
jgi:hypothetical protein